MADARGNLGNALFLSVNSGSRKTLSNAIVWS